MTKYFSDILNNLRNNEPREDASPYYLFLLGTGVNYVDVAQPNKATYVRGETFSYTAQLVKHVLAEKEEAIPVPGDPAHALHTPSVDVINGPDAAGREIGDRIAKALLLTLAAIANGQTNQYFSGFSRGGVEAIVLTHELERIRNALNADLQKPIETQRTLAEIITESISVPSLALYYHNSQTRYVLSSLVPNGKQADDFRLKEKLLAALDKLKVNLFVLDPVPGGDLSILPIGWQEPEYFYKLPKFVNKKEEIVQKHETTCCFIPIIPEQMSYEVLPGCHGTGDGWPLDHNSKPIPNKGNVSAAQDLVLRRWIDFADLPHRPNLELKTEHEELNAVALGYLAVDKKSRDEQLTINYQTILKNHAAYQYLSTTNYAGLGKHSKVREVHFCNKGFTPVTSLDAEREETCFVNQRHVQLAMEQELKSFDFFEQGVTEQVKWLNENIKQAFTNGTGILGSLITNPLFQNSLSSLINTVTQKYLRNHLSKDEQNGIRGCVIETFDVLDKSTNKVAPDVKRVIQQGLTATLIQHQNAHLLATEQLLDEHTGLIIKLSGENPDEASEAGTTWLLDAEQKYANLKSLAAQIQELNIACDQNMLTEAWKRILPNYSSVQAESKTDKPEVFDLPKVMQYIRKQQELLLTKSIVILSKMPAALAKRPDAMQEEFYQLIRRDANVVNLGNKFGNLQEQSELQARQITAQQEQIALQQCTIAENATRIATLEAFRTKDQERLMPKIRARILCCRDYLKHLNKTNDGTPLHASKLQKMEEVIELLINPEILPEVRLTQSETMLLASKETFEQHRDPMWQRFLKDFLHIAAQIVTLRGFYHLATQEGSHFFKPTHGGQFIEDMAELKVLGA